MSINIETYFNTSAEKRFVFPGCLLWGIGTRRHVLELQASQDSVDLFIDGSFSQHPFIAELLAAISGRLRLVESVTGPPGAKAVRRLTTTHSKPPGLVIALGGGSTLDFAKACMATWLYGAMDGVGMGARRGEAPRPAVARPCFVAVPTTAGSGAEASRYFVTYDEDTRSKVHGKSWQLVADWIVMDPEFLNSLSPRQSLLGAFDAFVHFFESMLCRGESSWFGQMLSTHGIARLMRAMTKLDALNADEREQARLELLYCATTAGIAISNVRTGNIHEAAGALLERTRLTHSETLYVFFRSACEQYAEEARETLAPLFAALVGSGVEGVDSIEALVEWWERRFEELGVAESVRSEVGAALGFDALLEDSIFDRVWADKVWVEKESPRPLTEADVRTFIRASLVRFARVSEQS